MSSKSSLRSLEDAVVHLQEELDLRNSEIEMLQQRMSTTKCMECDHKDEIIADILNKMESMHIVADSKAAEINIDKVMRNISDLNRILSENAKDIKSNPNGASFCHQPSLKLEFTATGITLEGTPVKHKTNVKILTKIS